MRANEVQNADVQFISLVNRAASRVPIRITKAEESLDKESTMIHLSNIFGLRKSEGPKIAALAINRGELNKDSILAGLQAQGFSIDNVVESDDGILIAKQDDGDLAETLPVRFDDTVAALVRIEKSFDPPYMSASFTENVGGTAFYPSVMMATEALAETVRGVLAKAANTAELVEGLETAVGDYQSYVVGMAGGLPDTLFKFDASERSYGCPEARSAEESVVTEKAVGDTVDAVLNEAQVLEVAGIAEETTTTTIAAEDVASVEEAEAVVQTSAASESTTSESGATVLTKADVESMVSAALASAVEKLKDSLSTPIESLRSSVESVVDRIEKAEGATVELQKALKGTVVVDDLGDDEFLSNLGGRRTSAQVQKSQSDDLWQGTALDRLI